MYLLLCVLWARFVVQSNNGVLQFQNRRGLKCMGVVSRWGARENCSGSAQESLKVERAVEAMRLATYAESDRVKRIFRILVQRVNVIG